MACQKNAPPLVWNVWFFRAGWASQYRAVEDCFLMEVPKEAFQSEIKKIREKSNATRTDLQLADVEEALQVPSNARSFQQLQVISSLLEKQPIYGDLDSYIRLEVCQWATLRLLGFGEDIGMDSECSCYILHGEISVRVMGDQRLHEVFTAPVGLFLGEEVGMSGGSGDVILHPTEDSRVMWLDKSQLPQQLQGKLTGEEKDRSLDKATLDRNHAIQTLKFKAPEQRSSEDISLLVNLLQNNAFFAEQEDLVLREICRAMSYMEISKHSVIVKQGDVADMCYVMMGGSAGVWVRSDSRAEGLEKSPRWSIEGDDERELENLNTKETKEPTGQETPNSSPQSASKRFQKAAGKLLSKGSLVFQESQGAAENRFGMPVDPMEEEKEEDEFTVNPSTGGLSKATKVKEITVGACFGETGLLHGALRNASIIAAEHCHLGAISKALFERELRAAYLAREQKRVNFLREYLPTTEAAAQALGGFFTEYQAGRGHVLCVAGKVCERLMIIRDGLCKVRVRQDGVFQDVGEIGKGQWIGLTTIGGFEVEPFTVTCTNEVVLLRMDATDARTRMSSELREAVVQVAANMHCRMQRRADLLRTAFDTMAGGHHEVFRSFSPEPPRSPRSPRSPLQLKEGPKDGPKESVAQSRGRVEDAPRRQLQRLLEKQQRDLEKQNRRGGI